MNLHHFNNKQVRLLMFFKCFFLLSIIFLFTTIEADGKNKCSELSAHSCNIACLSKGDTSHKAIVWKTWSAHDSTKIDHINDIVYLYGNAKIIANDLVIEADYIKYDRKNKKGTAIGHAYEHNIVKNNKKEVTHIYMDKFDF